MYYQNTVELPISRLRAFLSLLDSAVIEIGEKNLIEKDVLEARLAPDMFPLVRQIQIVTDNAKGMAGRLGRKDIPKYEDVETTFVELRARLERTIAYLETFTPTDFSEAATVEVRFPWTPGKKIIGENYLIHHAIPNFFFHLVTAYAILRKEGFDIGKDDYLQNNLAYVPDNA